MPKSVLAVADASLAGEHGAHRARNRTVIVLLAIGLFLMTVAIGAAVVTMLRNAAASRLVEHTLTAEATINRMARFNEQVETGRRGFIISGNPAFARIVRQALAEFDADRTRVAGLVADNLIQVRTIANISAAAAERERLFEELERAPADRQRLLRSAFEADRGTVLTRDIRAAAATMADREQVLLRSRNQRQLASLVQLYVVGGAALALLILVLGAVIVLIGRYNRHLTQAQNELRRANEGLEDAVAARTAELSRANAEIQRFAYIVSHDLRSPLVNVLGFTAELDAARKVLLKWLTDLFERQPDLRDEAVRLAVEEDIPEALGFIRTSTEKMDRLINSILQLSRQGRRQLTPALLDMDALAASVVATLHQRMEDAGATVIVDPLPALESDRTAIEQILSNLVENAIKYAHPQRPPEVRLSGRQAGKTVEIDVADNGRGIDPKDHERIFELFRRSGTQDKPGEGIGLANVRALAYRLGGTVEVESKLDHGTCFRLSLPARFSPTEPVA